MTWGLPWTHDNRGDGRVIVEGLALGGVTGETVVAMNGWRGKVVGASERHQQLIAKHPKVLQQTMLFQVLKDLKKHDIEFARRNRIEQVAHLIVAGDLLLGGARHPPERTRCPCGSGTNATSFSRNAKGASLSPVVPSDHGLVSV